MKTKQNILAAVAGICVGAVNGLFGGGGGMIAVPTMCFLLDFKSKHAHATAILVILPLTIISLIIYLISNSFSLAELLLVTLGVVIGGVAGAFALKKLSGKVVTIIFAIVMILSGIKMLF